MLPMIHQIPKNIAAKKTEKNVEYNDIYTKIKTEMVLMFINVYFYYN